MSYTPTNWNAGDVVTAEKLNKIEQGIEDITYGTVVIELTFDSTKKKWYAEEIPVINENVKCYIKCDPWIFEAYALVILNKVMWLMTTNIDVNNQAEKNYQITYQLIEDHDTGFYFLETVSNPNLFVVTLTPTAQDYSGTMDKTPEEIDEAYRTGRRIRFRVMGMDAEVDATQYLDNTTPPEYYQAAANVIYNGMLVQILTSRTDQIYSTIIYSLTPMS